MVPAFAQHKVQKGPNGLTHSLPCTKFIYLNLLDISPTYYNSSSEGSCLIHVHIPYIASSMKVWDHRNTGVTFSSWKFQMINFGYCISSYHNATKTVFSRFSAYFRQCSPLFTRKSFIIWNHSYLCLWLADIVDKNENLALQSFNSRLKFPHSRAA